MGKTFAAVAADDAHGGAGDDTNDSGDGERVDGASSIVEEAILRLFVS